MGFWRHSETNTSSLPELIRSSRRARVFTLFLIFLVLVMAFCSYITAIWPIFSPPDQNNSAVHRYLASDDFKSNTGFFYDQLEKFNARSAGSHVPPPPRAFIASSGTQAGIIITARFELARMEKDDFLDGETAAAKGVSQYFYRPNITIILDPGYLSFFIVAESAFAAFFLITLSQIFFVRKEEDRIIQNYEEFVLAGIADGNEENDPIKSLCDLLPRFHTFVKQLQTRFKDRDTLSFKDEYDVQDAMHALLRMLFVDVRVEEYTPSYAAGNSRIDFLISREQVGVEVKMARANLKDRELANELIIDIARYQTNQRCKTLLCFIYDPNGHIANPHGLITDLEVQSQHAPVGVKVIISPLN